MAVLTPHAERMMEEAYKKSLESAAPPPVDFDEVAKPTWELFSAFKKQGFTDEQALELVNTWFSKMLNDAT